MADRNNKNHNLVEEIVGSGMKIIEKGIDDFSAMLHIFRKRRERVGSSPGTIEFVGYRKIEEPRISIIDYNKTEITEKSNAAPEDCACLADSPRVSWIAVEGLHDVGLISGIAEKFGIHPLTSEDIANTGQRPKIEEYGEYTYVVIRGVYLDGEDDFVKSDQISLILGKSYVISFQETHEDIFAGVRHRITASKGRIRERNADYLAYALLDSVVDGYFSVLEQMGERIEQIDDELAQSPEKSTLETIRNLKKNVIFIRKSIFPLRDVLGQILKEEFNSFSESTMVYMRDVYDHIAQVLDTVELYRDILTGLAENYNTSVSNQMNEVMKTLTIMASIFIPLTFIAGVYGMNFDYMPEIHSVYAYPALWAFMILSASALYLFFRRKKWL